MVCSRVWWWCYFRLGLEVLFCEVMVLVRGGVLTVVVVLSGGGVTTVVGGGVVVAVIRISHVVVAVFPGDGGRSCCAFP